MARKMAAAGADIIDVGGESTRPGAAAVSEEEEISRIVPVVRGLRRLIETPISIDSSKSAVVRAAFAEGADIVNDVTAFRFDSEMARLAVETKAPVILMHMQGTPRTMQRKPTYQDVVREVREFLAERMQWATRNGIDPGQIVVDPGIGFGKTLRHNLLLLNGLSELVSLGRPVLVGASRKAFIGKIVNTTADYRLEGSLAVAVAAVFRGANIIRAHDVKETRRAVDIGTRSAMRPTARLQKMGEIVGQLRWQDGLDIGIIAFLGPPAPANDPRHPGDADDSGPGGDPACLCSSRALGFSLSIGFSTTS